MNGATRGNAVEVCCRRPWSAHNIDGERAARDSGPRKRRVRRPFRSGIGYGTCLILSIHTLVAAANHPSTTSTGPVERSRFAAVAPALELPAAPGGSKLNTVSAFDRPLLPTGTTTPVENLALAAALERFAGRTVRDDFSALQDFLENNPDSAWSPGLETQLGHEYYRVGRYSRAIAAWRRVWESGRSASGDAASAVVNEAGSELALMYARLGRMTELAPLLDELGVRPPRGVNPRALRGASDGFWSMQHRPRGLLPLRSAGARPHLLCDGSREGRQSIDSGFAIHNQRVLRPTSG